MKTEVDVEEEREKRAFKKADVKVGAVSRTIKSFANSVSNPTKKKVVVF